MPNVSSPEFILSKKKVLEKYNLVRAHADIISYSSKTNQDIVPILEKETDAMFSIHFENELKHVKDLSRVIFLAQGWDIAFIKSLLDRKITHFIVDNESDLDTLIEFLKNDDRKISLFLRMKLRERSIKTERYFVFGMSADIINKRIKELRTNTNIDKLGVHFHRKTQNMSEWNLKFELSHILEEDVLGAINYLNIGGGLPSEYANTNIDVLNSIFEHIDELRVWLEEKNTKMIIEPGRFIAAPAVKLETNVLGIHENNIIVNASVYNSDMDAIVVPVKLRIEGELDKTEGKPYVVKGITPCSMDLFRYRVYLKDIKVGEKLVFLNAGAYNFTSDFCDLEKIPTRVVD